MKIYKLFSNLHLKECKKISSKIAMHTLLKKIHTTWKKKLTTIVFLFDVSNAFDNVFYHQLFYNFRKRKIDDAMLK